LNPPIHACVHGHLMGAEIYPMMPAYTFSKWVVEELGYNSYSVYTAVSMMCVEAEAFAIKYPSLFPN